MTNQLREELKIVAGVAPSVDIYNGNPASDVVSLRDYQQALFVLRQKTAGTNTGTATVTVEACDSAAAGNPEAIAFSVNKNEAVASSDAVGAAVACTTSGFVTVANKDALYQITVKSVDLPRGKPFVRLQLTETVNDPVAGDVLIVLGQGLKAAAESLPSAIA